MQQHRLLSGQEKEEKPEDEGEESTMVTIRRVPRVAASKTEEGSKIFFLSTATNEMKEKFDIDLVQNDEPLFVASLDHKSIEVAHNFIRTGEVLFDTCAKHWDVINRMEMAKEWASDKILPYDFAGNLRVDNDKLNVSEVKFEYPDECLTETVLELREADVLGPALEGFDYEATLRMDNDKLNVSEVKFEYPDECLEETVLELRETGVIAKSEIMEPIVLDPKRQRYMLKKLSRRLSSQSENANKAFAHLLLFSHLMNRSQETLDEVCNEAEGYKDPKSSYKDTICILEDADIFPHFKGSELSDVVQEAQTKALSAMDKDHVDELFDYSRQKISEGDMAKFTSEEAVFCPRSCPKKEERNGRMDKVHASKYLQDFYAAHNKNVDAFCALLANEETAEYRKYPTWERDNYQIRLGSDVRIREAIGFRLVLEQAAQELREDLYSQRIVDARKPTLFERGFSKNGIRAGIATLQAEIDTYNLAHVAKINASILKRIVKFSIKMEMPAPDLLKLERSKRHLRKLKYLNENGVPHNMKYGRWFVGKLHTFKGNIAAHPLNGKPVKPGKYAVKAKSALQYAFLTSYDARKYSLENCATLSDNYEGCSATFDFAQGTVALKVQYGTATREMTLSLPTELRDSTESMEMRWAYKGTQYYEDGLPSA